MNLQSRPPSYLFGWIVKKIISNNQTTCSLVTKVYQMVFSFFLSKTMSFCTRISTKVKFGCSIFNYFDYTPYWPKPSISFDFSHDKNSMAALNFRVFSLWFFVSNLCNLTPNCLFNFEFLSISPLISASWIYIARHLYKMILAVNFLAIFP